MTKIELKKSRNRKKLLKAGYDLFSVNGVEATTISSISRRAGVSKGSFYLYFKDKYELRDDLVIIKSNSIINDAIEELELNHNRDNMSFSDKLIFVIDYILKKLSDDHDELRFISKNLSLGLLSDEAVERMKKNGEETIDMEGFLESLYEKTHIKLKNALLLFYTILEMVNSTCYSMILENKPIPFSEYKDFLYDNIRLMADNAVKKGQEEAEAENDGKDLLGDGMILAMK
ncbi:MAG: TetR/AcrR family transcriptional regulator [Eubacteriales bacterium]|nr:TetR/AcrR family transcriptional regulator [Eubacteriales bacterium]